MASKKLESEFINLKKEFLGLQAIIQNLLDKHGDLEKKYDKFIQNKEKTILNVGIVVINLNQ